MKSPKLLARVKQQLVSELNCNILLNEVNSESENEASGYQYYCLFSLLTTALCINVLRLIVRAGHTPKAGREIISKFGQVAHEEINAIQNSKITDLLTNTRRTRASTPFIQQSE